METWDTIVVGAGISGVTAANLLSGRGRKVVVLEARDRVGGRTFTDHHTGVSRPIDVGASWIHGIDGNPLMPLVEAFDVATTEFTVGSFQPDGRPIATYGPDGHRLDEAEAAQWVADIETINAAVAELVAPLPPGTSFEVVAEQALAATGWDAERQERVREFLRHRIEEQCGGWIGDLDAHGLDGDAIDGDEVVFPNGYDVFARTLAEGLDIRLGHIVREVVWAQEGVVVRTDDAEFRAAQAIVTVPLGVLKTDAIRFEPALPDEVAGPIERLGFGRFEKLFLEFAEPFWDADVYAVRQQGERGLRWHSWYDVTRNAGVPMLLTFAAGRWAELAREEGKAATVASALDALRAIYGDAVPEPVGVHLTEWGVDPFAMGSYSYVARGGSYEDHDRLAGPVGGVLHFAGEAATDEPATVHTALLSGARAAERVLGESIDLAELRD
ncbi:flavin monoamine oxidase family protein [Microbacterium sp. GXF7504]